MKTTGVPYSQLLPSCRSACWVVAAATWWFLYDAEGLQVTFYQLVRDGQEAH